MNGKEYMKFGICITTRNRAEELEDCLRTLRNLSVQPLIIVVSDDSADLTIQRDNHRIASKYNADYLVGPQKGVCANRNSALRKCLTSNPDYVSFVDDDICLDKDFLENAIDVYHTMSSENQQNTILTGITETQDGERIGASRLTFRGYFTRASTPEVVNIHAAVFPRSLFESVMWDENIFFGYEDAELCLRALSQGFSIVYVSNLIALHTRFQQGTLVESSLGKLSQYDISIEAARLYIGIKRYKFIFPSPIRLAAFMLVYFAHMAIYLARKGEIGSLRNILALSNAGQLLQEDRYESL
jgi:GT2 family glycosyltransferase